MCLWFMFKLYHREFFFLRPLCNQAVAMASMGDQSFLLLSCRNPWTEGWLGYSHSVTSMLPPLIYFFCWIFQIVCLPVVFAQCLWQMGFLRICFPKERQIFAILLCTSLLKCSSFLRKGWSHLFLACNSLMEYVMNSEFSVHLFPKNLICHLW